MKKILIIILLLCCIFSSYAQEPIAIYRVKSIAFNYDVNWSHGEHKGLILLYKDKIVNKTQNGEGEFIIAGNVESFTSSDGIEWQTFECLNDSLKACILAFGYRADLNSAWMDIMYETHRVRYMIDNSKEHY